MDAKVYWTESSFTQLIRFVPITTKRADIIASGIADTPERRDTVSFLDYSYDPQVSLLYVPMVRGFRKRMRFVESALP